MRGPLGFTALTRLSAGRDQHLTQRLAGGLGLTVRGRTGALLGLDQSRGSVHTDDQAAGDLGVERPAVAGLLHPKDPPDPRHHLVGRRVRRLVQVDEARPDRKQEVDVSVLRELLAC